MSTPEFEDPGTPVDRLRSAAQKYEAAEGRPELQLEAIVHSVGAAIALLCREHDQATLAPLQQLFAGLSRLISGRADPVLRPLREKGQAGRPPPDASLKYKQVCVLVAVEILLRGGWKIGAALTRIAELASAAGLTGADRKSISDSMIRNWRSDLSDHPNMRDVSHLVDAWVATLRDRFESQQAELAVQQMLIDARQGYHGIEDSENPPLT